MENLYGIKTNLLTKRKERDESIRFEHHTENSRHVIRTMRESLQNETQSPMVIYMCISHFKCVCSCFPVCIYERLYVNRHIRANIYSRGHAHFYIYIHTYINTIVDKQMSKNKYTYISRYIPQVNLLCVQLIKKSKINSYVEHYSKFSAK